MTKKRLLLVIALAVAAAFVWGPRAFAPKPLNAPPGGGPIVALGDSLTAGFGVAPGRSFAEQLSAMIGRPIVNAGVNGDTVADGLRRLERDVLAHDPAIVIVCLGGNDLLRRNNADAAFASLETIVERIQDKGAMVVLVGVEGLALISADFGSRYADLAERRRCLYVPDILDGIWGRSNLMQGDNVHPNAEGARLMAERVAKALRPHL
jgi:acyl-CoA thioesterase-1